MKTTVDIADAVLDEAKRVAQRDRTTVRALIEEGLREVLARRRAPQTFRIRDVSVEGDGLQPELQGADWAQLRGLIYEGRGG